MGHSGYVGYLLHGGFVCSDCCADGRYALPWHFLGQNRRVPIMPVIAAVIVGIFGALTLIFNDDTFIKMKPDRSRACAILLGGLLLGITLLKRLMGSGWPMTDSGWRILTRNFGLFFAAMAVVNEIVWRTQSEEFWVNFKVFGSIALTLAFSLTQVPTLNRYKIDEPEN